MACACACSQQQVGSSCACGSSRSRDITQIRVTHIQPLPLVPVGELRGVIYRRAERPGEAPKNYVHFFDRAPLLAADAQGRRLFIIGGHYRVTKRGIEG